MIEENKLNQAKSDGKHKLSEKEEFIRFMALPFVLRKEEYGSEFLKDFAKKYKVNPVTLSRWQKEDGFWSGVRAEMKKWAKNRTPNVVLGLYRRAVKEGNASEAKFWMQYIENWKEKTEVDVKTGELKEILKKAEKIINEHRRKDKDNKSDKD